MFIMPSGTYPAILAHESISLHRICHCLAFAFQSARTHAEGSNINCISLSSSGGQTARPTSAVCDNAANNPKSSSPTNNPADLLAFIIPAIYHTPPRNI